MIPENIVQGRPKPYMSKEGISFGAYTMVYTKTTKNTKARSVLDIALCKSNDNGCYHFIYLYTGKIIDGYK